MPTNPFGDTPMQRNPFGDTPMQSNPFGDTPIGIDNQKEQKDEPGFFGNLYRTVGGAGRDVLQSTADLTEDITGLDIPDLSTVPEPTYFGGSAVRDIAGFLVPYAGVSKVIGGVQGATKLATAGRAIGAGTVAEQFAFSPNEQRLSNVIQERAPNAITEFLQADPDDPVAKARFKMALEGAGLGALVEAGIATFGRATAARAARKQEKTLQETDQTLIETAGTPGYTGEIDTVTKRPSDVGRTVEDIAVDYVAPAVKGQKKQKVRRDPFKVNPETRRIGTKIKGDQYDIVENADGTYQPVKMDDVSNDELNKIIKDNPIDNIEIERLKTTKVARPIGEPVNSMQSAKDAIVEFTTVDKLPKSLQTKRVPTGAGGKELPRVRSLFTGKVDPDAPEELAQYFWGKGEKILPTYKLRQKNAIETATGGIRGIRQYDDVQEIFRENYLIPEAIPGQPDIGQEDLIADLLERNPYIEEAAGGANYENWYRDTTAKEQIIKRLEEAGENPYRMTDEQVERAIKQIDEDDVRLERLLNEQQGLERNIMRDDEIAQAQFDTRPPTLSESIDLQTSVPRAIREQEALRLEPKDGLQKQIAEEPTMAGNINLEKLDAPVDVKQMIKDVADDNNMFLDARQNVVRFGSEGENLKALADETGLTVEKLLQREKGEAFNFATAYAARLINAQSAKELTELAKKAESTSASQVDLINFEKALVKHAAIQEQIAGITAEAGRALAQFRYMAKADALTQDKMITEYLLKRGGDKSVRDVAGKIANMDSTRRVSSFARESYKPTFLDKVQEVWINGLLSSPSTHIVNVSSNTLVAGLTPIEYAVAAAIGAIKRDPDRITGGEVAARTLGTIFGTLKGLTAAAKALKDPDTGVLDSLTKLEMRREKAVKGLPGEVVRLPGRALVAEDVLFKTIGYTQEMWGQAVRQAQKEGKGLRHAKELLKDPDFALKNPNIKLKAIETGRYQTFTNNLEGFAQSWQRFIARTPGFRFLTPFVRTPYNIVTYAFERTPFARLQKKYKDAIDAGGPEADIARARMYLGTSISMGVAMLAADGMITGRGPSDPRERAVLMETGWQPYSIKIGDTYYGYNRFEPVGILFGVSADLSEIGSYVGNNKNTVIEDAEIIGTMLAMSITENITNKTFLTGISDLVEAISDPGRYAPNAIRRFLASSIPTVAYYERKDQDPYLRDVRSTTDAFLNRLPGQSEKKHIG